jgi:hypothetical protein
MPGVKIYPDAAHGFLSQHHAEFAADVSAFLAAPAEHPQPVPRSVPGTIFPSA